jgi:hypothetical protein
MHMNLAARFASVALIALFPGCATTELVETWVDPQTHTLPRFHKVFVAYLGGDSAAQRLAEDSLAEYVKAEEVGKCYALYSNAHELTPEHVKDELRAKGFDGAIVMRLARITQDVSYTANSFPDRYGSLGGYWGYETGNGMEVHTNDIVQVVTNFYSIAEDKLLYTARSESFNPGSSVGLVTDIAAAVAKDLKKKGLTP